jgi:hypothetical protein
VIGDWRIGFSAVAQSDEARRNIEPSEIELSKSEAATQDSLEGYARISVNLRNLGLYDEDLSRRDSVKVAQYEVLGNDAKRRVRPGRDDRKRAAFWSRTPLSDRQHRSIVPFLLRPAVASLWRGLLFAGAP